MIPTYRTHHRSACEVIVGVDVVLVYEPPGSYRVPFLAFYICGSDYGAKQKPHGVEAVMGCLQHNRGVWSIENREIEQDFGLDSVGSGRLLEKYMLPGFDSLHSPLKVQRVGQTH